MDTPEKPRRRPAVTVLLVAASLLAFLAVFSIWANRQLLQTDSWVETSSELLEDEEIRAQLSNFLVDELYSNVDVQAELQKALPPRLQPLAGPAAAGLRQLTDRAANEALERPRVQALWESINRVTHEELIEVVEEDTGEPVVLDLGDILGEVGTGAGINIADRIPPDAGQIEILPPDELTTARKIVNLIEGLALWLTILALGLFALAVYLAEGRRRETLRSVGIAFVVVGLAVGLVRTLGGDIVVDSLASSAAIEPAVENTYDIGTGLLSDGVGAMVFYGLFVILGAWLAGPSSQATTARRHLAPVFESRAVAYAVLAALLLALFWWAPTEGFKRLPISIVIVLGLVGGFEVLRRQVNREFPGKTA